jgi:Carboxypeptidase regulatory-like domain
MRVSSCSALLVALLQLSLSPSKVTAQPIAPPPTSAAERATSQGLRISGMVHDSTTGFPLVRAVVQLVDSAGGAGGRMTITDADGRYAFSDVPAGRYLLGFHHPVLDSLGLDPLARGLDVSRDLTDVLLTVPSAVRIREGVCGAPAPGNPGTLVMGFVRDAVTRAPLANATVAVEWLEYELGGRRMVPRIARRVATSGANGWYGVCNIPSDGFIQLAAHAGEDSTELVEIPVVSDALLRRELFVGRAATMRIAGTVLREGNGRPLENATVSVVHGPSTRTNAKGEFVIPDAPAGTRLLDVRAVGYYPQRTLLDVVDNAPAIRTEMRTFKSVLDTVKVLANYGRYTTLQEMKQRAQSGIGRFISAEAIARRNVVVVSELMWTIPGVYVERAGGPEQELSMRGLFSPRCTPSIFLNAFPVQLAFNGVAPFSIGDIDAMVRPSDLLGVEIYAAGQVPPVFGAGMTGCGAIAFWTK